VKRCSTQPPDAARLEPVAARTERERPAPEPLAAARHSEGPGESAGARVRTAERGLV